MSQPSTQPFNPADLPLRDYHLPQPVSWWPPAPGWWGLLLICLGVTGGVILLRKHWLRQEWRREGQRRLGIIESEYREHGDGHRLARDLSVLMRRICLTRFPTEAGSHLHGKDWLKYIDSLVGKKLAGRVFFGEDLGEELLRATCDPVAEVDAVALLAACRQWLDGLPSAGRRDL